MKTLALIGLGRWGKNYINTISQMKNCKLKYLCSSSVDVYDIRYKEYNILKDYRDLHKYKDIDGIIIATPAVTHYRIASYLVKKNLNLLIEKPIVTNINDLFRLENLLKTHKSIVMAGHLHDYNPGFIKVKKNLPNLGKLNNIIYNNFSHGPIRSDVSMLWDIAYHNVYLTINLLGKLPIKVSGYYSKNISTNQQLNIILYFEHNLKVSIHVSWFFSKKIMKVKLSGEKGTIMYDDIKKIYVNKKNKEFIYSRKKNDMALRNEIIEFIKRISKHDDSDMKEVVETVRILNLIDKSIKNKGKIVILKP